MEGRRGRAARIAMTAVCAGVLSPLSATAASGSTLDGVPRVAHVVTWVLENESFATTWSASSPAKYLNGLVPHGAFVPRYFGTGHVSLDNYIAMTSGLAGAQVASTYTDCLGLNLFTCAHEVSTAASRGSVADQVEGAGLTWKQYADGTSAPCVHDSYAPTAPPDSFQGNKATPESSTAGGDYADRHVPFLYYTNIIGNAARCAAHLRPFTELRRDIAANTLPSYAFVTPDTCDDGHDMPCADGRPGGLASADAFLAAHLPPLLTYLQAHDGLLLITFDEAGSNDLGGCCTGGPAGQAGFGGQVGLLALGPMVAAGKVSAQQYDHASLLRTVEDALGISTHLHNAAAATAMRDIWAPRGPLSSAAVPRGQEAVGHSNAAVVRLWRARAGRRHDRCWSGIEQTQPGRERPRHRRPGRHEHGRSPEVPRSSPGPRGSVWRRCDDAAGRPGVPRRQHPEGRHARRPRRGPSRAGHPATLGWVAAEGGGVQRR